MVAGARQRSWTAAKYAFVAAARGHRRMSAWFRRVTPHRLRGPVETVDTFDVWAYLTELADQVSQLLERHGIEHLVLTERLLPLPQVVVPSSQAVRVRHILRRDPQAAQWWLAPVRGGLVGRAAPAERVRLWFGGEGVAVVRNLVSESGTPLTNSELGVRIDFWRELTVPEPATGGGEFPAGTLLAARHNGVLDYAGPELWRLAQRNHHRLPVRPPHLLVVAEPVDLVYTWVDGDDPAWQARKSRALGQDSDDGYSADAAIAARFESRDELRYSLRSVEMFANWCATSGS